MDIIEFDKYNINVELQHGFNLKPIVHYDFPMEVEKLLEENTDFKKYVANKITDKYCTFIDNAFKSKTAEMIFLDVDYTDKGLFADCLDMDAILIRLHKTGYWYRIEKISNTNLIHRLEVKK